MGPETVNRNRDSIFHGDYAGRDLNVTNNYYTTFQDSEREFVVTHNADIKPVSYFTGRETELQELRQRIEDGRKSVLISGMGGIGKTHICRKLFEEYLNRHADGGNCPFKHIGYIEYSGDMGGSLQSCLKFKEQDSPEKNQEAAWKELEYLASDGKLLLFVDNVDRPIGEDSGLQRLRGVPGAVVLTSRQASFSDEFEPYRIGFLNMEQCKEIYEKIRFEGNRRKIGAKEVQDLEYVIENLAGKHTITVELLAHLARTKLWTVKRLKEELEQKGFRLMFRKNGELVNIQESYELLYDLSTLTEAEHNILEAFSVFPYIPLAAETCNQWLLEDAGANEDDDILMGLYQKGWLQFDVGQEGYALHPVFAQLIYEKCRPTMEKHTGLIEGCQRSMKILRNGSIFNIQKFLPFADSMVSKMHKGKDENQAEFIDTLANMFYYIAEYKKAEKWYKESLKIYESIWGDRHSKIARGYNDLGETYYKQGKYLMAEESYKKSLKMRERMLGEEHPDTAECYNNLGTMYAEQGKYADAEKLYKKSLKICERMLGEEHPDTVKYSFNLGELYSRQGKYEKAKKLIESKLRFSVEILGEGHLDTARGYNILAGVYEKLGEYEKMEELCIKSLRIRENIFGKEHPDTVNAYEGLASIYMRTGEYGKGKELYGKILSIYKRVFGINHENTARAYNNFAYMFQMQGKSTEAEVMYLKSLEILKKIFGEENLNVAEVYTNLAGIYESLKKYEKAEGFYKQSLNIYEKIFGEEHPCKARVYNNLACMYSEQGKRYKALDVSIKAYRIWALKLGLNHSNTLIAYENMKYIYFECNPQGNFDRWLEEKMKE